MNHYGWGHKPIEVVTTFSKEVITILCHRNTFNPKIKEATNSISHLRPTVSARLTVLIKVSNYQSLNR